MTTRDNTNKWYCEKCDFYVFNSKPSCKKCLTKKPYVPAPETIRQPMNEEYDNIYKSLIQITLEKRRASVSDCTRCQREYKQKFNREKLLGEDLLSSHNCWKYE